MNRFESFGQPVIRGQLDIILQQGRLPHAILFYGEPGHGILPAALSLARDILCTHPQNGKACGQCPSCHRAEKCMHPDLHFLLPLAGAKSLSTEFYDTWRGAIRENPWLNVFQWTQYAEVEGKQVDIHKEDIVQATSHFSLEAYEGGSKVMIIWMAQFLAKEGNRLLKLIEEPQPRTYFILVSNQREQILPTIRSRCMQLYFPPLPVSEIEQLLVKEYGVEPGKAALLAKQSVNDMGRALSLVHNNVLDYMDEMTVWFRALLSRRGHDLVAWSNKMGAEEKEEQKQFALFAISFIQKLVWAYSGDINRAGQPEKAEMMQYLSTHFSPDTWYSLMQWLESGFEKISRNANTKLLWLSISLNIKNHLAVTRRQHSNV